MNSMIDQSIQHDSREDEQSQGSPFSIGAANMIISQTRPLFGIRRARTIRTEESSTDIELQLLHRGHHSPLSYLRAAITVAVMTVSTLLAIGFVMTLNELRALSGDNWVGTMVGGVTPPASVAMCLFTFLALQRTISSYLEPS